MNNRRIPAYAALGVLFAISLIYHAREIADRTELFLHGEQHAQRPFDMAFHEMKIDNVRPEAEAAGIHAGDMLAGISGRPFAGAVDFYAPLKDARPGDRLDVEVQTPSGQTHRATIQLQPRESTLSFVDAAQQVIGDLVPVLCLALGFWVAAVRIADPLAWIFLALMMSFAEFFGAGLFVSVFGYDDIFQPLIATYIQFSANVWGVCMMFFGIYFPERFYLDRKWPWAKWLLAGPILLRAIQLSIAGGLAGKHLAATMAIESFLHPGVGMIIVNMLAISCFFASLGHKTFSAPNADARRRVLLLYAGATVSVTPAFIVSLVNLVRAGQPFERSTWTTVTLYLMLIGFPLTMTYAILVQRAMDVRVAIRQGLQYLLASKCVLVLQVLLSAMVIFTAASLSAEGQNRPQRIQLIALGVAAVALIQRFAIKVRAWIDRRFFREAYDAEQLLSELATKVRTMVETGPLLQTVAERVSDSLHIPRVAVLLNGGNTFEIAYALGYGAVPSITIPADTPDIEKAAKEQLEAEVVLPLSLNEKILGILSLGPKKSEAPYSRADLRLLGSVATQTGLALENSRLTAAVAAEVAQRERMNRELEIAREVQERLFPQDLPPFSGIDYAGACRPALGVGGDYYDFIPLSETEIGIAIGDVSGKGIPAALLMASLRASLRGQTIRRETDLSILMANVNKLLFEGSTSNRYATFFYAEYNVVSRRFTYVNAGHNPPMIFRKGGHVIHLETGGPVVGLLPSFPYAQSTIGLSAGDTLVAFTDGISEAMNSSNEEWGDDRLIECVKTSTSLNAQQTISHIMAGADAFTAGAKQHDDMTIVVMKIA